MHTFVPVHDATRIVNIECTYMHKTQVCVWRTSLLQTLTHGIREATVTPDVCYVWLRGMRRFERVRSWHLTKSKCLAWRYLKNERPSCTISFLLFLFFFFSSATCKLWRIYISACILENFVLLACRLSLVACRIVVLILCCFATAEQFDIQFVLSGARIYSRWCNTISV